MRILILANKPPYPSKDGSSLATLNMALGLVQTGNEVTILAISTPKHNCTLEQIPNSIKEKIRFHLVYLDTKIRLFDALRNLLFSKLPYNIERFIDKSYLQKIQELIFSKNFEIIQIEGLYLLPYADKIRKITTVPIVYRSHNLEHEIWQRLSTNEKNWFKKNYLKLLSRRLLKFEKQIIPAVSAIVTISSRELDWFIEQGAELPKAYIPVGFQHINIDTKILNGITNKICFIGSLDWTPNKEGLLWFIDEVWPIIQKKESAIELHIAGRNAPKQLVERFMDSQNVFYHGEVESAVNFLSHYSILIVPLLSGSGMRVKIVEGMMLRKAIVTTTLGIEGIEAKNKTHAVIADSPSDFAKAIVELAHNPELRREIAEKAFTFATENYDLQKLTNKLTDFYTSLVK